MLKVLQATREVGIQDFDKFAEKTNVDEGKLMISFVRILVHTRVIGNWGREEDTDDIIGLSKEGWIIYRQVSESGAGKFTLTSESFHSKDDLEVLQLFNELNLKEQLDFIDKCLELRKKHRYDFDSML